MSLASLGYLIIDVRAEVIECRTIGDHIAEEYAQGRLDELIEEYGLRLPAQRQP